VLKFKLSQVTDVAEKEDLESMINQVITGVVIIFFVECCSHLTNNKNFWLLR